MSKRDYYEVLGISKTAGRQEIKSAYRKLAKKYHPDRNKEAGAEDQFKEIQEAYEILSDEKKRAAYDKYGHAGTQGFGGFSGNQEGFGGGGFDFGDFGSINDIFEQFFGGGFGGFSNSSSPQQRTSKGRDLEINLNLQFNEAVFGTSKELSYKRIVVCDTCQGSGAKAGTSPKVCPTCHGQGRVRQVQQTFIGNIQTVGVCPTCNGTGQVIAEYCKVCGGDGVLEQQELFKIKIPQGIPDGVTLRFKDKGDAGRKGGSSGDLFVNIEVQQHDKFERRGNSDIYLDLEIDLPTAVLGSEVTVPTVNGSEILRIPAGTQYEDVLKMSGKGGPKFKGSGNGDQYVRIIIKIPQKLTKEQKALWQQLEKIKSDKPGFFEQMFN